MDDQKVVGYDSVKNNVRTAITLLSIENKEFAIKDEVMIDKQNGQIYYKRPDGVIVKSPGGDDVGGVIDNISRKINQLQSTINKFDFPKSNNAIFISILNALLKRTENANIVDGKVEISKLKFPISIETNGFFITANTRLSDRRYVEILTGLYATKNNKKITSNATLFYNVIITPNEGSAITLNKSYGILLNESSFVPVDLSDYDDINNVVIEITGVSSDIIRDASKYPEIFNDGIRQFITNDSKIIVDDLTTDYFVDNMDDIPTDIEETQDVIKSISTNYYIQNIVNKTAALSDADREAIDSIPMFKIADEYNEY